MGVEIEKVIDELNKEIWFFVLIRNTLFLDGYELLCRESTRKRKYNVIKRYDRLQRRYSTIEESEVPLTSEIKKEALQTYFDTIDCRKWSEKYSA